MIGYAPSLYPFDSYCRWGVRGAGETNVINVDYPTLLALFPEHLDPERSESASMLVWYLQNYYRLNEEEAVASVCDQRGDKGVDGIYVNDDNKTITIFQARISQKTNSSVGDKDLREFAGTMTQFATVDSIKTTAASAKNVMLGKLIARLDLINKVATHELRGAFISNIDSDQNGNDFLAVSPQIEFIGKTSLVSSYISDSREALIHGEMVFDIGGFDVTEYTVDATTKTIIAPVRAKELVKLEGIADQSLFDHNVRGPLGATSVNKDIVLSIKDNTLHRLFPLFHNGITIICRKAEIDNGKLTAGDYFVVNGCQSLTALFNNRKSLTDDLRILTKFVRMDDPASEAAKMVTRYSNNQNSMKPRDFMSNNKLQVILQNEVNKLYGGAYYFEIKRGELGIGLKITNEDSGLLLLAFDIKQPWATHRKYQLFEDNMYADVFGRPAVTADRIIMCEAIREEADQARTEIANKLFGKYILTRYLLVYLLREILENSPAGKDVIENPGKFIRDPKDRERFKGCIRTILKDLVVDINGEVQEAGKDFDYRDKLRDEDWIKQMRRTIVTLYQKLVGRGTIKSFGEEWDASS